MSLSIPFENIDSREPERTSWPQFPCKRHPQSVTLTDVQRQEISMTNCRIDQLGNMDTSEERKFWILVERELRRDDGAAAKSHLATGLPIYYCPGDCSDDLVREWPDGRKELVQVNDVGDITYVRSWHQSDAD